MALTTGSNLKQSLNASTIGDDKNGLPDKHGDYWLVNKLQQHLLNDLVKQIKQQNEAIKEISKGRAENGLHAEKTNEQREAINKINQQPEDKAKPHLVVPPGWILVQQHYNGSKNFNRGWNDYKNGFGDANGDYWIGNDWLHMLTSSGRYKVRFDLQSKNNSQWYWAEYTTFRIGSENTNYTLTVGGYSGTAGDSFKHNNGNEFATLDHNNLKGYATGTDGVNGGFWYGKKAGRAFINGSPDLYSSDGVYGFHWCHLPVGKWGTRDRELMTSRMWLVPPLTTTE